MRDLFSTGRTGTGAIGTWVKSTTSENVEIMAFAGFDFVVIDMEHSPLGLPEVAGHIVTAAAHGVVPLVRVPDHGTSTIQRVLDAGARGVLVPHVDTVEQAEAVVDAARFPPHGIRGSGNTSRAGRWGLLGRDEYTRLGNEEALVIAQLESRASMENADAIVAVRGLGGAFVGASDLALDAGIPKGDPELDTLMAKAVAAAGAAGLPIGYAVGSAPETARRCFADGYDFVVMSNDLSMLAETACALVVATRGTKETTS